MSGRWPIASPDRLPRTLDSDGRAATVFGLAGPGGKGLILDTGQRFRVDLTNDFNVGTIIHWHGQIPPDAQDGLPDMPMPLLAPGETRFYDFEARPGTHWMHSHVPTQEIKLLAAPLIVRSWEDRAADWRGVMFLHDISSKAEVLAEINRGHGGGQDPGMPMRNMPGMRGMMGMGGHLGDMAMNLNDHDWDAYLANDRMQSDP